MADRLDEICPPYVADSLIALQLSSDTLEPRAFGVVDVLFDFSACDVNGGIVLPLELLVTAPSPENFRRVFFRHQPPALFTFRPQEAGRHLVRIAEVFHNRAWGALLINVGGELSPAR